MVLENGECSFVRISADLSHHPSRFNWYCRLFSPCKNKWGIAEPILEKPDKGFLGIAGCSLFSVLIELGLCFSAEC